MRFYKTEKPFKYSFNKEAKVGDIFCNSLYYGWIKVASNKDKTEYFYFYNNDKSMLERLQLGVIEPLTKFELLRIQDHLKKEIKKFDFPISLQNDVTEEKLSKVKRMVVEYKKNKNG